MANSINSGHCEDSALQPLWDVFDFAWGSPPTADGDADGGAAPANPLLLAIRDGTVDDEDGDHDGSDAASSLGAAGDAVDGPGAHGSEDIADDGSVTTTQPEQTPEEMSPCAFHERHIPPTIPHGTTFEEM